MPRGLRRRHPARDLGARRELRHVEFRHRSVRDPGAKKPDFRGKNGRKTERVLRRNSVRPPGAADPPLQDGPGHVRLRGRQLQEDLRQIYPFHYTSFLKPIHRTWLRYSC